MFTLTSPSARRLRLQCAARRADGDAVLPCLAHDMIRDAAGGVAAGPGTGAVTVPEIQRDIGVIGIADFRKLIKPDPAVTVAQAPRQRSRGHRPAPARVDHDKVVAQPVHLHEGQAGNDALFGHRRRILCRNWFCQRGAVCCRLGLDPAG
jgi:hypothetical protein